MRRRAGRTGHLALAALALLLAAVAVGFGSAPSFGQGDRLQAVRVCGVGALDRNASQCKRDQSGSALISSAFHCSARARAEPGERFSGRLLYRGQPFPAFGTSVGDRRRGVYVYITAGPYPLAGGAWSCELRVGGETVRKSFRSAGPVAPILHVRVCRSSATAAAGPTRVCARDESGTAFRSTDSITCSAVFVGGKGKLAGIAFLHEGETAFDGDFELPLPITAAGPRLDPDPNLATGNWACRWTLAGRMVASKQFRIG
jgi:hypothetical protein